MIIPAYNEEQRIESCLCKVLSLPYPLEVIVVADGCLDRTVELASRFNVTVVTDSQRLGKGGGILKGFDYTSGEYILVMDVDLPVSLSSVKTFVEELETCDFVIASRYMKDSKILVNMPAYRRLLSFGFRKVCCFLLGESLSDFQCGFKAFKRNVLEAVGAEMIVKGFAFDVELISRVRRAGFKVKEVPVVWRHDPNSKVCWREMFSMLKDVLRVYVAIR